MQVAPAVAVDDEDSYARPEDSPLGIDAQGVEDVVDGVEDIDAESGAVSVRARALPTPKMPSAAVVAHHNLTHFPYRSWCPFCVAGRRNNSPHMSIDADAERDIPAFHGDYCFIKDGVDEQSLTVLVARITPSQSMFASPCVVKGPGDEYTLHRLEAYLKDEGVAKLAYRTDQEASIVALLDQALTNCGKTGVPIDAAPEHSAVGESASNGKAERTVQQFEDLIRTLKAALESRVGCRIDNTAVIMSWLVQHTADIFNRHSTNSEGRTPYESRHGRRSHGRTAEFGERVMYYVPKKLRSKLDLRWRVGVFLGTATRSNEAYVGTRSGNVVRSRSICRVVEENKWSREALFRVTGSPARPCPNPNGAQDHAWIESEMDPHAAAVDVEVEQKNAGDGAIQADGVEDNRNAPRVRITQRDLNRYGYSNNCPRCRELQRGRHLTKEKHSEECRLRIYGQYEANDDPKWKLARRELQLDGIDTNLPPQAADFDGLDRLDREPDQHQEPKSTAHKSPVEPEAGAEVDDVAEAVEAGHDHEAFPDGAPDGDVPMDRPPVSFAEQDGEDGTADLFMDDGEEES